MTTHKIPSPKSRNRTDDLRRLARQVITDRVSSYSDERLNAHVAESPDLLTGYVSSALGPGAEYHVQWSLMDDNEAADLCTLSKEWSDYCFSLFDEIPAFLLQAVNPPAKCTQCSEGEAVTTCGKCGTYL